MKSIILIYGLAIFVRIWLHFSNFQNDIVDRVEVTTPANSFYRILESHYRTTIGIDPYSSDVLHESPLYFEFYKFLVDNIGNHLYVIFIICDVLTAFILYLFSKEYMLSLQIEQHLNKSLYMKILKKDIHTISDYKLVPIYVTIVYLYNPYIILNCVGCTTTIFLNLTIALYFYGISCGSILISTISLALSTVQAFYPITLISPLYMSILKYKNSKMKAVMSLIVFLLFLFSLLFGCRYISKNLNFFQHTYGFILNVTDQQPNIGIYWYFFMEMIKHFEYLFICAYQINVTIVYFLPLTIKFRRDPILLAMCFLMLITIFKSYPSVGDFGLTLALLPCWKYLYNCTQQLFISGVAIFMTTALAPIFWDLWIYWGSANANFYFGSTITFITANIFILTDLSFAHVKHDYLLKYGKNKKIDNKIGKLVLR